MSRRAKPGAPQAWLEDHITFEGDGCLLWPFARNQYGYGVVRFAGKARVASRLMCEFAHGVALEPGQEAAHSCGNGHLGCVNPRHLRWADHKDNHADRIRNGTILRGEDIRQAKLSVIAAREIRKAYQAGGIRQRDLAAIYGVSRRSIGKLLAGQTWAHAHPGFATAAE